MTAVINSRPRTEKTGVKDQSIRQPVAEPASLPQHLPYAPDFAEWGPEYPVFIRGGSIPRLYGTNSLELNNQFTTHMTPFINMWNSNANPIMYHRQVPPDATKSILRLSVEVIETDLPVYARNEDGTIRYTYDNLNQKKPVVIDTIVGHRLVYHLGVEPYEVGVVNRKAFGQASVIRQYRSNRFQGVDGDMLGEIANDPNTEYYSQLFPIWDIEASYFGSRGDQYGMRIQLPTTTAIQPIDIGNVLHSLSYLPRLSCVERNRLTGGYNLVSGSSGESTIDVSLRPNVRTDRVKMPLSIGDVFLQSYVTEETMLMPRFDGPFGKMHVYQGIIEELQALLIVGDGSTSSEEDFNQEAELKYGRLPLTLNTQYMLNFLGGYDYNGVPYFSFETNRSGNWGGHVMTSDSVVWANGGSDGLFVTATGEPDYKRNYEMFDALVQREMANFGDAQVRWMNSAKYPISAIWDSGYSLDTKKALLAPIGKRKDIATVLSTQSIADYVSRVSGGVIVKEWDWIPPNNEGTETAIAANLRMIAMAYPESEVYGTSTCRAIIVGGDGNILNSSYGKRISLTYDFANKVSRFLGSSDGFAVGANAYDLSPNNIVDTMRDLNITWRDAPAADKAWSVGLTYVEDFDLKRQFYPAVRTVYINETSVLVGSITMFNICFIQRTCDEAWREIVGNSKFTREKFIQLSNDTITAKLAKRFDDRHIIVVDTYFDKADDANGFSWSTRIDLYSANMKLVGAYTITANRIEDYKPGE